jgi:hypothetical protein
MVRGGRDVHMDNTRTVVFIPWLVIQSYVSLCVEFQHIPGREQNKTHPTTHKADSYSYTHVVYMYESFINVLYVFVCPP